MTPGLHLPGGNPLPQNAACLTVQPEGLPIRMYTTMREVLANEYLRILVRWVGGTLLGMSRSNPSMRWSINEYKGTARLNAGFPHPTTG